MGSVVEYYFGNMRADIVLLIASFGISICLLVSVNDVSAISTSETRKQIQCDIRYSKYKSQIVFIGIFKNSLNVWMGKEANEALNVLEIDFSIVENNIQQFVDSESLQF